MAANNDGQQGLETARASRLRLTDTGVEEVEATAPPATNKPVAENDETKAAADAEEAATLLDEGDGPAEAAQLETTARRGRFRRVLVASGVVAGLLALVLGVGYFWLFSGAQPDAAYQVKPTAPSGNGVADPAARGLTAEEIAQELQKHTPPLGASSVSATTMAAAAVQPGNSPITDRLPNQDFSATVTPTETPQPAPAHSANNFTPATAGAASVSPGNAVVSSGTEAKPTPAPASYQAGHSIRARPAPTPRLAQAQGNPEAPNNARASALATASPTPAPTPTPVGGTPAQAIEAANLPPLGTLLPVRTVATIYTLRNTAYVRLQVSRDVAGQGWSLLRGTEFYGQLSGAETKTGRAFITLLGFIESGTSRWVELSGQLLGADGTEGLPGRTHKLNAGWRNAFKKAGSVALDTVTTIASGLGRRGVIITDGSASRIIDPLTDEAKGLANGRDGDSFIEIPAATSGYILVMPGNKKGSGE